MEDAGCPWAGAGVVDGGVGDGSGLASVCGSVARTEWKPVKWVGAAVKIAFVPDSVDITITPGSIIKSGSTWRRDSAGLWIIRGLSVMAMLDPVSRKGEFAR